MSPRSLFNIILKVIGIYFVKDVIVLLPQLFSGFLFFNENSKEAIWIFLNTILILAVYFLVIMTLVLKTDWVIDKFELERGIAEKDLSFKVHRSTVLDITLFVIGIIIIITVIPSFCRSLFSYFQEKRLTFGATRPSFTNSIIYGIEILLGLGLIIYRRTLINFIELKRRRPITPQPDSLSDQ